MDIRGYSISRRHLSCESFVLANRNITITKMRYPQVVASV